MTDFIDTINTMPAVFANAASYVEFHDMAWDDAIDQAAMDAVNAGASFTTVDVFDFVIAVIEAAEAAYKPIPFGTKAEQKTACGRFCDIAHRMENWKI